MKPEDIRRFDVTSYDRLFESFRWRSRSKFNIGVSTVDQHAGEDDVAIIDDQEDSKESVWRYKDLKIRSNQVANLLREIGGGKNAIVGVVLPAMPETVVTLAAIYKLGGVALSISPLFGVDAILYRLRHSGAKAVVMEGSKKEVREELGNHREITPILIDANELKPNEVRFEEARKSSTQLEPAETRSGDPAHLFYTSGTTGPPKGVIHAHRFLLGHLPCFQLYFELAPKKEDIFWTPADWGWIGALGDVILPSLYFGMPIVASRRLGRFEPGGALDLMERHRVTCAFLPPTALRLIRKESEHIRSGYRLNLRAVCSAGESVGGDLVKWGREQLGAPINEFYGCTECNLVLVTSSSLGVGRDGAMGKASPGHVVEVLDETGEICPPGRVGQIAIKSPDPIMFLGYWKDREATKKKFCGDWFLTGDLGFKDAEGYFWFKSRADDVIKSSGYRIGPEEVEQAINAHPAVLESAVIGRPDEIRGTVVTAFVVLRTGSGRNDSPNELRESIQDLVRKTLSAYAYPRNIKFVAEIPKTETGKIRRFELRERSIE